MAGGAKRTTKADRISKLLTKKSRDLDENDFDLGLTAPHRSSDDEVSDFDEETLKPSKMRRQAFEFIDTENKYAGTKGSRKDLDSLEDDEDSTEDCIEEEDDASEEEDDDNGFLAQIAMLQQKDSSSKLKISSGSLGAGAASSRLAQANAVKNQLKLLDNTLEINIRVHKALVAANSVLNLSIHPPAAIASLGGPTAHATLTNRLSETLTTANTLAKRVAKLQSLLLGKANPKHASEYLQFASANALPSYASLSPATFESKLASRHAASLAAYKKFAFPLLKSWHERVLLRSGLVSTNTPGSHQHKVLNQGILDQIDQYMSNYPSLYARTKRRRQVYPAFLPSLTSAPTHPEEDHEQEQDAEIFDDTDFYQQLIRELIASRGNISLPSVSSDAQNPAWSSALNLINKNTLKRVKKNDHVKHSRVSYEVQKKLVNFMFPDPPPLHDETTRDLLARSLFKS